MAYEYGTATGHFASEVLEKPVSEIVGYFGYLSAKKEMIDNASDA